MSCYETWLARRETEVGIAWIRQEEARLAAQLAFAEGLCALHPDMAGDWRARIADARTIFRADAASGSLERVRQAVRRAEDALAPLAPTAKSYVVHCIGHAHIDMNWQWGWAETAALTCDTFDTVLRLMDEFPEFHFSQSQAACYEIIERYRPEMLDRIRRRVAEGRWELIASHWVENDKNLVGGEALCRHLLQTRTYLHGLFGDAADKVRIDWAPDTFGHAATVPSYLAAGGVTRYFCTRAGDNRKVPAAFRWEAPDGSAVLVLLERENYNGRIEPQSIVRKLLAFVRETGLPFLLHCFGVGDHGGGPTRLDLRYAREMGGWPVFPTLELARTEAPYACLEEKGSMLPVWKGALNAVFTGCYGSQAALKTANRRSEAGLIQAQTASALALPGADGSATSLDEAWRKTLFLHFHDILPGSGAARTREHALGMYQEIAAATLLAETRALRALAETVDIHPGGGRVLPLPPVAAHCQLAGGAGYGAGGGALTSPGHPGDSGAFPFVLFNLDQDPYSGVATATLWERYLDMPRALTKVPRPTPLAGDPLVACYANGERLPVQVIESGGYWHHEFATFAFPVRDVPGFGYDSIVLAHGEPTATAKDQVTLEGGYNRETDVPPLSYPSNPVLDNGLVRLEIDQRLGGIRCLYLAGGEMDFVLPASPLVRPCVYCERPHPMTSWLPEYGSEPQELIPECVEPLLRGPYRASVRIHYRHGNSRLSLLFTLDAGSPDVRIDAEVDWLEIGSPERGVPTLSLSFPFATACGRARYSVPLGAEDGPFADDDIIPALDWLRVSTSCGGREGGVVLGHAGTHAWECRDGRWRVILLRGTYDPDPLPDLGMHAFSWIMHPFEGAVTDRTASTCAARLMNPLRGVAASGQGWRPRRGSALELDGTPLQVLSLRREGDTLAVRMLNTQPERVEGRLRLDPVCFGPIQNAYLTDLHGGIREELLLMSDNAVSFPAGPHALCTLRIRCAAPAEASSAAGHGGDG